MACLIGKWDPGLGILQDLLHSVAKEFPVSPCKLFDVVLIKNKGRKVQPKVQVRAWAGGEPAAPQAHKLTDAPHSKVNATGFMRWAKSMATEIIMPAFSSLPSQQLFLHLSLRDVFLPGMGDILVSLCFSFPPISNSFIHTYLQNNFP